MKNFFLYILAICLSIPSYAGGGVVVMFWNLENFFDYRDGGQGQSDTDFSSYGERRWTKGRFYAKCNAVAKAVFWLEDHYGRLPDVIGFAEVENGFVLNSIFNSTSLKKSGYSFVHYDSGDSRGIDVALAYRDCIFRKKHSDRIRIHDGKGGIMATRDILYVCMEDRDGCEWNFLVNHHPSKFGGKDVSGPKRIMAMQRMADICDSLVMAGCGNIVSMGDFNDTPDGDAFRLVEGVLINHGRELAEKGEGSLRYKGKWELIDMFMVSDDLSGTVMEVCRIPFLMVRDNAYPGEKPLRTYSGPKYTGGVSDHCPVVLLSD